jgi:predicted secreted protein
MAIISALAVYFVIWWLTLFVVLPIGLRTQAEDGDVVPGTVASAPTRFRGLRVMMTTTIVSALIYGGWYVASTYFGISVNDLPRILPEFGK